LGKIFYANPVIHGFEGFVVAKQKVEANKKKQAYYYGKPEKNAKTVKK
jgi:hypothetical protein